MNYKSSSLRFPLLATSFAKRKKKSYNEFIGALREKVVGQYTKDFWRFDGTSVPGVDMLLYGSTIFVLASGAMDWVNLETG